jgi:site-specific recombinase XerD
MEGHVMDATCSPVSVSLVPVGKDVGLAIDLAERAKRYAEAAKATGTRRAYQADWEHFEGWCADRGICPLPAEPINAVLAYLTAHAETLKVATLQRRLVAIRERHRYAGHELDTTAVTFRDVWRGIRRQQGRARPVEKKAPLMTAMLRRAIRGLPDSLQGHRDRALLLIGFAGGLRRSELASLELTQREGAAGWIEVRPDGLAIRIAYSKADQEAEGDVIGIPFSAANDLCPVLAFKAWIRVSGITEGAVFRPITRHGLMALKAMTGAAVALIVKRIVRNAALAEGSSDTEAEAISARFAGHSLRAGHATSAAAEGAPGHSIQRQLRHRSFNTTVGYIRQGTLFQGNSASFALR